MISNNQRRLRRLVKRVKIKQTKAFYNLPKYLLFFYICIYNGYLRSGRLWPLGPARATTGYNKSCIIWLVIHFSTDTVFPKSPNQSKLILLIKVTVIIIIFFFSGDIWNPEFLKHNIQ